jgi:hypothetical protein
VDCCGRICGQAALAVCYVACVAADQNTSHCSSLLVHLASTTPIQPQADCTVLCQGTQGKQWNSTAAAAAITCRRIALLAASDLAVLPKVDLLWLLLLLLLHVLAGALRCLLRVTLQCCS